jgi:FKBP-type peptidyl-prolyl cis-trans isomerase
MLINKGAKATLYIPSTLAYGSQDRSPQIPANSILIFDVEVLDIEASPEQPTQRDPAEQANIDDKLLQDYFKKNNIKATKTPSGLYYTVTQKGLGATAAKGKKVTMNYTGKTLDGKLFDSNVDPKFNHVSPFTFTLGVGQVIKGWDEGVQLLQLGAKGSFFIPSGLAYGPSAMGNAIAANSVLIFDVEVVGID